MNTYPYRCGRLDDHTPHEWTRAGRGRTYACNGHVITEAMGRYIDDLDDAAEDAAEKDRDIEAAMELADNPPHYDVPGDAA